MSDQYTRRAVLVPGLAADSSKTVERIAITNADGTDVRDTPIVTTGTAIGTAAKTTTAALPRANTLVAVKFTNGNSAASATLAFATGGAKTILLAGAAPTAAELTVAANGVALFLYDGTSLHQIGVYA